MTLAGTRPPLIGEVSEYELHHRARLISILISSFQIYISGEGAGEPGTPNADKETIEKLLPNRLEDQFCFRTQDDVEHLEFMTIALQKRLHMYEYNIRF